MMLEDLKVKNGMKIVISYIASYEIFKVMLHIAKEMICSVNTDKITNTSPKYVIR